MRLSSPTPRPGLPVRTGLSAGGYNGCLAYCDQEQGRCLNNPGIPQAVCDDRHPVCQNACAACSTTAF